jgi:hypothetical protein
LGEGLGVRAIQKVVGYFILVTNAMTTNHAKDRFMNISGATRFEQSVISMSLIHLSNQESHVGQEMRKQYNTWRDETDEAIMNPWHDLHWFTIYVPHPEQEFEDISLEAGLTRGYNIEVKRVEDRSSIPYQIPEGGHFVVVLKQQGLGGDYQIAATGIFVRLLAALSLDVIVDRDQGEYQHLAIHHPIIREYPSGWEEKLSQFLHNDISSFDLPNVVGYVDQFTNWDYRPPSWNEVSLAAKGFAGV